MIVRTRGAERAVNELNSTVVFTSMRIGEFVR